MGRETITYIPWERLEISSLRPNLLLGDRVLVQNPKRAFGRNYGVGDDERLALKRLEALAAEYQPWLDLVDVKAATLDESQERARAEAERRYSPRSPEERLLQDIFLTSWIAHLNTAHSLGASLALDTDDYRRFVARLGKGRTSEGRSPLLGLGEIKTWLPRVGDCDRATLDKARSLYRAVREVLADVEQRAAYSDNPEALRDEMMREVVSAFPAREVLNRAPWQSIPVTFAKSMAKAPLPPVLTSGGDAIQEWQHQKRSQADWRHDWASLFTLLGDNSGSNVWKEPP